MASLAVGLLVLMTLGVVASAVLYRREMTAGAVPEEDLEFYQIAYLAGGRPRVAEVGLAYLVWAGLVEARPNTRSLALRTAPPRTAPLVPVEAALVATIPAEGGGVTMPLAAARNAARGIKPELDGLVIGGRRSWLVSLPALASAVLAAAVSLAMALSSGPDIALGFLPAVPVVGVIVLLTALPRGVRLTVAGQEVLSQLRERFDPDLAMAEVGVTSLPIESGLYIVALYGRDAMTGELSPLRRILGSA